MSDNWQQALANESPEWIETCRRDYAWEQAREDVVGNDAKAIGGRNNKWKRCVYHNNKKAMTDADWDAIIAEYPRG